jgi:hypothetical protein
MNYPIEIITHTPTWVWLLLAFLVYRGLAALKPREVQPSRALIVPLIFLIWGGSGLLNGPNSDGLGVISYVVALAAGLAIGRGLAALAPAPSFNRASGLMRLSGSAAPLILTCLAFAAKYSLGVSMGIAPELRESATFAALSGATGGLMAGVFWGRALGQFARALHADGQSATLTNLVNLAFGRESQPQQGGARP